MENSKALLGIVATITFIVGVLIGSLLSLLYAPQSGKRTRRQIHRASADAQKRLLEAANKAKDTMNDLVDQSVEKFNDALESNHFISRRSHNG
jgi:gas vesicle protein